MEEAHAVTGKIEFVCSLDAVEEKSIYLKVGNDPILPTRVRFHVYRPDLVHGPHGEYAWPPSLVVVIMTDFTLLTLPKTSNAFTSTIRPAIQESQDGSASPRRKTPRLETDSDAPSASRYHRNAFNGSIRVSVIGDQCMSRVPVPFSQGLDL